VCVYLNVDTGAAPFHWLDKLVADVKLVERVADVVDFLFCFFDFD
jgi:hypothetical protein